MKLTTTLASLYCLFGVSIAISKRAVRLFDHALDSLDLDNKALLSEHYQEKANTFSLPGQDTRIPIHVQSLPKANVTNSTAQYFTDRGAIRSKLRYGPFQMDSMDMHEGMTDYLQVGAQMPCSNCTITWMQAGLEYENGTTANANTSAWLHHCILINLMRPDAVCGTNYYGHGERWFASGNERTVAGLSLNGMVPAGYNINKDDVMVLETELMNQAMYNQTVVLTITYEWIPHQPADFYSIRPIWMDVAGCHIASDVPTKEAPDFTSQNVFSYSSPSYTSDFHGAILGVGSHLHDGGINTEIYHNVTHEICNSVANYGENEAYVDAPATSMTMPMSPMFNAMTHISSLSYCYAPVITPQLSNGSVLMITANYDFNQHMPMLTLDGDADDIMGIAVMYVAQNMTTATLISHVGNKTLPLEATPAYDEMGGIGMMPSMGDDEDSDSSDTGAMSGMSMMGMGGGMDCVPMRDSAGTIFLTNINMSDPDSMNTLLTAIMCDSCLQAWSAPYARYFWYGIVTVIGLFGVSRIATWQSHIARKHQASQVRPDVYEIPASAGFVSTKLARALRAVSYRQITPTSVPAMFKLPPFGIILMILGYFGFVLGLQFTQASTGDLQTLQFLSVRAGWLSAAQLPLIVLLSTKRNFVTMLTAVTYERLNILHRWTSRGLLMTALMHFGFQWRGWANAGVVSYEMSDSCVPTGFAALALVLWMNLSTLAPFRNLSYEFFVLQHIITFFGTIIAIAYHIPSTAPYALTYVYITSALYLVSKLVQAALFAVQQRRRGRATITPISSTVTKITVHPSPFKTWKAGSFARLSIPKLGLVQSHPATIASTPTSHNGDLVFFLLRRKGFTHTISRPDKQGRDYAAVLDGPYGGSQHDMAAFHTTVLVAGSTGITYTLSLLLDLAQRAVHIRLPLRHLVFIWSIRSDELVRGLKDEIASSVEALRVAGIDVSVQIHVTGTTASPSNVFELTDEKSQSPTSTPNTRTITNPTITEKQTSTTTSERTASLSSSTPSSDDIEKAPMRTHVERISSSTSSNKTTTRDNGTPCIVVRSGRADLDTILEEASRHCEGEMGVAVCGPLSMTMQVRNRVARMQFQKVGAKGVDLHVEGFSW